jgi:K+-transporting ATPase ATPase B chain
MPVPPEPASATEIIAGSGGTPLAVARSGKLLGLAHLKDIVKGGIRERFAWLREMGIPHGDVTGGNPLTAAAIPPQAPATCSNSGR